MSFEKQNFNISWLFSIIMYTLPDLGYEYNALEPYMDEQTMKIHHTKHHQAYVDKLNLALEKYPEWQNKPVTSLIKNLNEIPEDIKTAVRNHGGGHVNHSMFWKLLKKDTKINGEILKAINKNFGNFDKFKEEFSKSANSLFGSGWCWLVLNNNKLETVKTSNQDNPISDGKIPILGIDLWEHSYYLKWNSNRAGFIENFYNIINWDQVEKNYKEAMM